MTRGAEPEVRGGGPTWAADNAPSRLHDAEDAQHVLQLVAEGLTRLLGFRVAVVNVVDGDALLVRAVAVVEPQPALGGGDVRTPAEMVGTRLPLTELDKLLASAEDWGGFLFVSHKRLEQPPSTGWTIDGDVPAEPAAWDPHDLLIAPILGEGDRLVGCVSIDTPMNGLRPGPAMRRFLNRYAAQAGRAVLDALEREALAERARLLASAREVIRAAAAARTPEAVIRQAGETVRAAFGALAIWVQLTDEDPSLPDLRLHVGPQTPAGPRELGALARRWARQLWEQRSCAWVSLEASHSSTSTDEEHAQVRAFLRSSGYESVLFAPIGVGPDCVGTLTLVRPLGTPAWTRLECDTAIDLGRDLGRMLLHARTFQHERQLVHELQQLDGFRTRLVAEVARRIDGPLTTMVESIRRLQRSGPPLDPREVRAVHQGSQHLEVLLDDLLALSRAADPERRSQTTVVDLAAIVDRVATLALASVGDRDLVVRVRTPQTPVPVAGDTGELERMVVGLTSNAVKFTPDGGLVTVALRTTDTEVELTVADTGIGIGAEDLPRVFAEFFRAADPVVRTRPGHGLGLPLVARIAERHGGRVGVESTPGSGSRFTVTLPLSR